MRGTVHRSHAASRGLAAAGLLVSSPVLAIAGLVIKLSSPGPVLFRAARVGVDGRPFTMYKLRTMHQPVAVGGARITGGRDSRVFRSGRWLRRAKIDELPQLLNVVLGDMAIVGPRPEDPSIVSDHYTDFMRGSLSVLPGLTSPGSLTYYADEVQLPGDPEEAERLYLEQLLPRKVALDVLYIQHRSWRYDLEIIVRTVAAMLGFHQLFVGHQQWEWTEAETLLSGHGSVPVPGAAT